TGFEPVTRALKALVLPTTPRTRAATSVAPHESLFVEPPRRGRRARAAACVGVRARAAALRGAGLADRLLPRRAWSDPRRLRDAAREPRASLPTDRSPAPERRACGVEPGSRRARRAAGCGRGRPK